jgi:hypothetical protein
MHQNMRIGASAVVYNHASEYICIRICIGAAAVLNNHESEYICIRICIGASAVVNNHDQNIYASEYALVQQPC